MIISGWRRTLGSGDAVRIDTTDRCRNVSYTFNRSIDCRVTADYIFLRFNSWLTTFLTVGFSFFLTWFYFHLTFHPLSLLVTEATAHNLLLLLLSVYALKAVQATSELGLVFYWYVYGLTHLGLSVESHSCCWSCFGKDVATTLYFFSGSFSFQWQTWIRHSRRRDVTCKGSAWISEGCEGKNNYLALRKCDN